MNREIRTAESVMCGHPDKYCDLVADMVLDACLETDPDARVACEVFAAKSLVVIGGEITTTAKPNYALIARAAARGVGYADTFEVLVTVNEQSRDIDSAVMHSLEQRDGSNDFMMQQGAGDQGIMIGYATDETLSLMPIEHAYASKITTRLEQLQRSGRIKGIKLDGKAQVSAEFYGDSFGCFTNIIISVQHDEQKDVKELREEIMEKVVGWVFGDFDLSQTQILVNPSGRFVCGGTNADTGVTGRKLVVDAYGPSIAIGGGAFSGKDPSKVDRSGAYMARYIAKNIVASGLAARCQVQLAYAIGKAEPLAIGIDTCGTGDDSAITEAVKKVFDLRPRGIIAQLDLLRPIYAETANGGHFGRDAFSWERTDKIQILKQAVTEI